MGLSLLGAQALANYAPVPDGYVLLSIDNSSRYLVAGGARFYIPPAQVSLYSGASTVALSQATINSYTQIPQDGTLFRQINTSQVYVVVGGMYWAIPSATELDYWDDWKVINNIPNSNWQEAFVNLAFSNKLLVQERTTSQAYLWVAGAKFPITNSSDYTYFGGGGSARIIPLGSLANITSQPWCGANLRERSSSTVYALGYISSSSTTMRKAATSAPAHSDVPDGALAPFPVFTGTPACIW
nr:hypothetical protein [Pyxidicoccus fallax]